MRQAEVAALGDLAGDALAAGGTLVQDMHDGIASRPFGILGPVAAPVRIVHTGVSRAVFGGVHGGLRALASGGARLAERAGDDTSPSIADSLGVSALNAMWGDRLTARGNGLALRMRLHAAGEATPRIAVFVHGLGETHASWRGRFGARLREDLGFTPVHAHYNTGLHVSENGRELARRLDALVEGWPVDVEDLTLVGHSMGGLVARSACHYGGDWTGAVRRVFCLGTPHLGADLEKGANLLGWALGRLPETRGLARAVNARSAGIKDLRYGACIDEDWSDCDPDEFLRDRCQEVPFLPDVQYFFIGATLNPLIGDLLVRMPSASGRGNGRGRRIAFEVDNGHELAGLTHFDLLHHPAVYEQLRTWITRSPARR